MNVQPVFVGGNTTPSALRAFRPNSPRITRPYSQVLHEIIRDPNLEDRDVRLVCLLLEYAKDRAHCWPSVKRLADDLRCSERSVQLALRRLASAGWVETMPDSNPTGRVIILKWRCTSSTAKPPGATSCAPLVQTSVVQPVHGVAPELDQGGREQEGRLSLERQNTEPSPQPKPQATTQGRPSATGQRPKPPATTKAKPMDADEMVATFGDWLSRPAGDSLRLMAERRLASMLTSTKGRPPSGSDRSPTRE